MTHGVVVCPKCSSVKAADLQFKTTKCLNCSKVVKLAETKIWARTDNVEDIPLMVGNVKAQLHNVNITYPENPEPKPRKKTLSKGSKREKLVFSTVLLLTKEKGTFTLKDLQTALKKNIEDIKTDDVQRFIHQLQVRGVLLEKKQGQYMAIEDQL